MEPALTAEEWKRLTRNNTREGLGSPEGAIVDLIEESISRPDNQLHAVAARALYGQPFGFTRDHVRLLRAAAEACRQDDHYIAGELDRSEWTEGRQEEIAHQYEAFAELIKALLPPEK